VVEFPGSLHCGYQVAYAYFDIFELWIGPDLRPCTVSLCFGVSVIDLMFLQPGFQRGWRRGRKQCALMEVCTICFLAYYLFQKTLCSPSGTTILFAYL